MKILVVSYSFLSLIAVYMCLLFYDLFSIIGYIGLVGICGEPDHVQIGVCAFPLRGVPGRYEYIWSLCWAGWRAGTGFLVLFGFVLACVRVIEQVGGVAGQYDSF